MADENWTVDEKGEPTKVEPPDRKPFEHSPTLAKLAKAMAAAQLEMKNPRRNKKNTHFGNEYADLAAVRDSVVPPLAKHGVLLSFYPVPSGARAVTIITLLQHTESEEWIRSEVTVPMDRPGAQAIGSAMTYAIRYGMQAIGCVAPADEDDDGEGATEHKPGNGHKPPPREAPAETPQATNLHAEEVAKLKAVRERLARDGANDKQIESWRKDVGSAHKQKKITAADVEDLKTYHRSFSGEVAEPGSHG